MVVGAKESDRNGEDRHRTQPPPPTIPLPQDGKWSRDQRHVARREGAPARAAMEEVKSILAVFNPGGIVVDPAFRPRPAKDKLQRILHDEREHRSEATGDQCFTPTFWPPAKLGAKAGDDKAGGGQTHHGHRQIRIHQPGKPRENDHAAKRIMGPGRSGPVNKGNGQADQNKRGQSRPNKPAAEVRAVGCDHGAKSKTFQQGSKRSQIILVLMLLSPMHSI